MTRPNSTPEKGTPTSKDQHPPHEVPTPGQGKQRSGAERTKADSGEKDVRTPGSVQGDHGSEKPITNRDAIERKQ